MQFGNRDGADLTGCRQCLAAQEFDVCGLGFPPVKVVPSCWDRPMTNIGHTYVFIVLFKKKVKGNFGPDCS
jgi:hypothetical protein